MIYRATKRRINPVAVNDEWVADDLVQETFIKVQKNLNQLRDDSKLSSWIFKIANNLCHDHFRKTSQSSKREQVLSEKKGILSEPLFQKEFEQHQMGEGVQDKIRLLPEAYQTVLVFFDLMEFSHLEIAEILDTSVEDVKVRLHRARKQLKTILVIAVLLFFLGGRHYNVRQVLGIKQIKEGTSNKAISDTGELDTSGVLEITRHPWYFATILLIWERQMDVSVIFVNVILTFYLIVGTYLEEKKLIREFGEKYAAYQNRVSMLLPYKWLKSKIVMMT